MYCSSSGPTSQPANQPTTNPPTSTNQPSPCTAPHQVESTNQQPTNPAQQTSLPPVLLIRSNQPTNQPTNQPAHPPQQASLPPVLLLIRWALHQLRVLLVEHLLACRGEGGGLGGQHDDWMKADGKQGWERCSVCTSVRRGEGCVLCGMVWRGVVCTSVRRRKGCVWGGEGVWVVWYWGCVCLVCCGGLAAEPIFKPQP